MKTINVITAFPPHFEIFENVTNKGGRILQANFVIIADRFLPHRVIIWGINIGIMPVLI